MRKASNILYLLGIIFASIGAITFLALVIINPEIKIEGQDAFETRGMIIAFMVIFLLGLVSAILARAHILQGVLAIVMGALFNTFVLIGGIFGLIAESRGE